MKITRKGVTPGERIWKGECRACESTAEASQIELKNITHDQRDGSFSWEICPVCGAGNSKGYGGMLFYPAK